MASILQRSLPYSLVLFLALLELLSIVTFSSGYPTYFKPTAWKLAHATFYGDESASATIGGACGYGNLFKNGYTKYTTAISPGLFRNGDGCGSCYQVMCIDSKWCISRWHGGDRHGGGYGPTSVTVTATNLGPPCWVQPSYGGVHFDLTMPAFKKIAITTGGIIPIKYRRVPCATRGGIKFSIQGNNYWLLALIMNVGGAGDIAQVWVKGSKTGWISMSHNWGASYQAFSQLGGQSLSFKLQSYSTRQIITAYNVVPWYWPWSLGMTYQAKVNFH